MKQTKFLTLKMAAERLGVSERSMYRYIHGKRLRAAKIGSWRIEEKDIEKFIKESFNMRDKQE